MVIQKCFTSPTHLSSANVWRHTDTICELLTYCLYEYFGTFFFPVGTALQLILQLCESKLSQARDIISFRYINYVLTWTDIHLEVCNTVYSWHITVVYRRIGYISSACWTHFSAHPFDKFYRHGTQECGIFHEIAVTPLTPHAEDIFVQNLLTAVAFDSVFSGHFY